MKINNSSYNVYTPARSKIENQQKQYNDLSQQSITDIKPAAKFDTQANKVKMDDTNNIDPQLNSIKEKDALSRTSSDWEYLFKNDKRLAEITAKGNNNPGSLTAEEVDYEQKARGFVNTIANLNEDEKSLYNLAVSKGNSSAAEGISQIALIRMMGHEATTTNGEHYDPRTTEINEENISKLFINSINDNSGNSKNNFQALLALLKEQPTS
ncbi:hypothetical protein L9G74_19255 [Shewanella sp. C32]|uniref:Uncharacterized protein n=1 Tax=Shewanella electrica TaxID=515560 RepID=A0ABT2FQF5_9GAMM|nr:hypothetical protein [Shewanella electrica]MCH1926958.1 hypothetical protein [Shewanella electrica]MCS4558579.1 hypothetical protein [Shewanella electrica]